MFLIFEDSHQYFCDSSLIVSSLPFVILQYSIVSLTYISMLNLSHIARKLLIYIKNNGGSTVEPWDTHVYFFAVMIWTHLDQHIDIIIFDI